MKTEGCYQILTALNVSMHMTGIVEQKTISLFVLLAIIVVIIVRTFSAQIAYAYLLLLKKNLRLVNAGTMRNTKKNDSDYMDWHIGTDKYSVNMHI